MLDIETTNKLASFLEAKFSLKNTTEIPRLVHGPLQFQQVASDVIRPKQTQLKLWLSQVTFQLCGWMGSV